MEPVLFRFEKFDFTKCEVHVSCPHCFALSKWPIGSTRAFECPGCPFSGGIRLGPAAIEEWQTWKAQDGQSGLIAVMDWRYMVRLCSKNEL